ncbi:T9SS type A sorting domain-containing protein, partial [Candidatus Bipolaricaulota bacterium]|nr:T9SS type A sorting domain-containing protein [Candidatus Bipolaricaulota bacterium]
NSKGPGTGYDDDDVPIFTGYMTFDDENLYLAFDVQDDTPSTNLDFLYLTIDIPPAGEFNNDFFANTFVMDDWTWHYIPVDALYWGSIPANPSFFGAAYETGGSFPWDRSQGASDWGTVGGVVTARTIIGTNRYYELKIPLAAIGAETGDTIGLKVQAREGDRRVRPKRQNVNYYPDMPDGITPIRADTRVGVEGNFYHLTLAPPPTLMSEFQIDHAKIDFKKKADDDKVRVQGKLELDLVNGDGVDISEPVTVTVGPLSETIPIVEKGKKGDKWEYKRPKDGEGIIKHMKIDWKNGKFDIRIDDVDLDSDEFPNPVTISVQIGDDVGSESITMSEKKHHWDYKAEKPKKPKAVGIEPFAITGPLKVVACPNPIRDVDTATFQVMGTLATQVEEIRVQIYDLSGRLVWEDAALGSELDWHTDNQSGQFLANGVYLYQVQVKIDGIWINQDIGKIA